MKQFWWWGLSVWMLRCTAAVCTSATAAVHFLSADRGLERTKKPKRKGQNSEPAPCSLQPVEKLEKLQFLSIFLKGSNSSLQPVACKILQTEVTRVYRFPSRLKNQPGQTKKKNTEKKNYRAFTFLKFYPQGHFHIMQKENDTRVGEM